MMPRAVRRVWGNTRVKWLSLWLYSHGHKRAARLAYRWVTDCPTPKELADAKANLIRRFPG